MVSGLLLQARLRRRDSLSTIDLSVKIEELAVRLHAIRGQRRQEAAELRAVRAKTKAEFTYSLQEMENRIVGQRLNCERVHLERIHDRGFIYRAQRVLSRRSIDAGLLSMSFVS